MQICFLFGLPLSFPNCEFHVLQAGDKRRRRLLYPSLRKTQDRSGERYKEGDPPLLRENQNEHASVPLMSRKQNWNDILTFFSWK